MTAARGAPSPAVFLDRDGTINVDHGYVHEPDQIELIGGAAQAIARLNAAGFLVIVVTNQSGVARGLFDEQAVRDVHDHMNRLLREHSARIDAFYFCPLHPEGHGKYRQQSPLRKPGTGMLDQACHDFAIARARSWMVGDKPSDIAFARRGGLSPILVLTGHTGPQQARRLLTGDPAWREAPPQICADLSSAVNVILGAGAGAKPAQSAESG